MFLNNTPVQFPENLDLNFSSYLKIDLNYKFCSVIEHIGTPRYGHYICAKRLLKPISKLHEGEQIPEFMVCNDTIV
jgi:hypothetical protein